MTTAYPLAWPPGFPRSKNREKGQFRTSYENALKNVQVSLRAFGRDSNKPVANAILSSNKGLLDDHPSDPGVAVWFTWDNIQICIPVDRYDTPAANLQAIHHVLEARRTELRHGTLALVRASFQGFKALPPPAGKSPWQVLGIPPRSSLDAIRIAYREKAVAAHPDRGGTEAAMAELNKARDDATSEVGA